MLGYLSKAISQLGDPVLRRVALIGIGGSTVVFVLLNMFIWWIFSSQVDLASLDLWGWFEDLLKWVAGVGVGLSLLVVSSILFPGVATIFVGFFLEEVVTAVEAKYYPNEPQPLSLIHI